MRAPETYRAAGWTAAPAPAHRGPEWLDYWHNDDLSLFAGEDHAALHFQEMARHICRLIPHDHAVVLDFGPGEALSAPLIAERCSLLILCEPSHAIRARLRRRFIDHPNISVVAPEHLTGGQLQTVDLAIVNSVLQYLRPEQVHALLDLQRSLLTRGGVLVIGDVPPAGRWGMLHDVASLLRLAWRQHFLAAALRSLVATFFSPYRKLRRSPGLYSYAETDLLALLQASGLDARRTPWNLGHNPHRMTFLARRNDRTGAPSRRLL